jgi:hypothetical protein
MEEDVSITRFFNTAFAQIDTSSHYSFEVRSRCNSSRLQPVDLHKILKLLIPYMTEYSAGYSRKFLTNNVCLFTLLLDVRVLYPCWLPAFLIRQKNNGMLLLTEWNWHNYEFWNLLYSHALAHPNHRNIVHKVRFNREIYACILYTL